jgi:membrane-associated protease RseP (regulator of RpoE activity)
MSELTPPLSSTTEYYRPVEVVVVPPLKKRYWLHLLLFLATIFTTLVVGARMEYNFQHNLPTLYIGDNSPLDIFPLKWALHPANLALGIPFSFTLMLILLAHEMGHYLYCRHYGVAATLPFFIPFPTLIGTLGAFIRIRSPIRSRSVLFDIGIAGPIAGFLIALPVLVLALGLSKPLAAVSFLPDSFVPGFPLIFRIVRSLLVSAGFAGRISHLPLNQICLHPTAMAAWVGMFATALNLLPGGQLDGGHIVFALAPRVHRMVSRLTILALIPMGIYFWSGWLIWAVLLRISGMRHPMVEEWIGISKGRRWLALFGLLMLILTLTPAPFGHFSLLEAVRQFRQ